MMRELPSGTRRAASLLLMSFALQDPLNAARAAVTTVNVADNLFSPKTVTISVNDSVRWVWTGLNLHSSTSTNSLWDSGIHGNGFAYTNTFAAAGSFYYRCAVHALQTGNVVVQGGNTPPVVAITSPVGGTVFSAPWTGTIAATASDGDGMVVQVDFYAGSTHLGTVTNPASPVSFAVNDLAAGDYLLRAVATDNGGATNASVDVAISVVTPSSILLSAPGLAGPGSFQFSFSATPGLTYIVEKSGPLDVWTPVWTNTAASNQETYADNDANAAASFYRVHLAPNP